MPLRTTLQTILTEYHTATAEPLEGHKLANFIRHSAASEVDGALGELGAGLIVEGSAGAGNWAAVPWISVFDPAITTSATRGYYVVYLFHVSEPVVHLSLNQGTTNVRDEFGGRARQVLMDRAELMRKRVAEFGAWLPVSKINLGSDAKRAYRALIYRGGIEGDLEGQSELNEEFGIPPQTSIIETRKYAYHR